MTPREKGFLLLTSHLGDPARRPLTVAQFRGLTNRVRAMEAPEQNRHMIPADLTALGYSEEMADRILHLLSDKELLDYYLHKGRRSGCEVLTRVSDGYPARVRSKLGLDSPGCLWVRGDISLLQRPSVSAVGSRNLRYANAAFAQELGYQAAVQGYVLVSGNARGADTVAQEACLEAGGYVISVVADALDKQPLRERVLYLSEDSFDENFSPQRALSRNRVIHSLSRKVFVIQSSMETGGTWDGTIKNLRAGWSNVFCFDDGSQPTQAYMQMGACSIDLEQLQDISSLPDTVHLFGQ